MPIADAELGQAIACLYQVFSVYPLKPKLDCCHHCVSDGDQADLRAAPLRQLGPTHLACYAFKAMTTWGSTEDFRHFLPRIFEWIAIGPGPDFPEPETVFGKLAYGKLQSWPAPEQAAVQTYCSALWKAVLTDPNHWLEPGRCLCSLAQVYDDLSPFLELWQPGKSSRAVLQLAAFIEEITPLKPRMGHLLNGGWWAEHPQQRQQTIDWILAPARVLELESAFFNAADLQSGQVLSDAFNNLNNLRQSLGLA